MAGSSPHTWRIHFFTSINVSRIRIISTYVEITYNNGSLDHFSKDHLHIRGDHQFQNLDSLLTIGSSPHTWRSLRTVFHAALVIGIISTYVEITDLSNCILDRCKDHLHIRGDHSGKSPSLTIHLGSSPHTWRSLKKANLLLNSPRIISTYVEIT